MSDDKKMLDDVSKLFKNSINRQLEKHKEHKKMVQDTFRHKNYIISIILSICLSRIKKVHTFHALNLERY